MHAHAHRVSTEFLSQASTFLKRKRGRESSHISHISDRQKPGNQCEQETGPRTWTNLKG